MFPPKAKKILIAESSLMLTSYTGLYALWYKGYEHEPFHWFDDSKEWGQMDKLGHSFSSYWLSYYNSSLYKWSGLNQKQSILLGTGSSWLYMSGIELFDGYSKKWGASYTDLIANTVGCVLYASQEFLFKEQIIKTKYSYSDSDYAQMRPEALGSSYTEKLLKDYNGQTYWLSVNAQKIFHISAIPQWLQISAGYSINGFTGGHSNYVDDIGNGLANSERVRQYLFSFDVDLTKIDVKNKTLQTVFEVLQCIKFPAPTIEIRNGKLHSHYIYF